MASPAGKKKLDDLREEDEADLYDWLSSLGAQGEMEVRLERTWPPEWGGVPCKGHLQNYPEPIDVEAIKLAHGGGRYKIQVRLKDDSGKWKYKTGRSFEVAGPPKVDSFIEKEEEEDDDAGNSINSQAMSMAVNLAKVAEARANRAEERALQNSGIDWNALKMLTGPLEERITALATENARLQERVIEKLGEKPDNSGQDRLFSVLENKESAHGNTIAAIRESHDSEMRQLRQFHRDEISRREDRFGREIDEARKGMERQISSLTLAHQQALESQRHGYEMRIETMKDSEKRLERELNATRTELAELRGKKDLSPIDQIQSIVTLKNGLDALSPSSNEPEKSGWERAAEMVMNSELVGAVAGRVMGGEAPEGQAQEQQDALVAVRGPDGKVRQIPRSVLERAQAARAAASQRAQEQGLPPDAPPLDEEAVGRARVFMENAYRNNTDPATFARTAQHMVPESILEYCKQQGVDRFLSNVAKIPNGSPLATVAGRTWIRQVVKYLLEGTTEGVED